MALSINTSLADGVLSSLVLDIDKSNSKRVAEFVNAFSDISILTLVIWDTQRVRVLKFVGDS